MKLLKIFLFVLIGSFIISSCGKDEPVSVDKTLVGKIRGVDFTFGAARYGSVSNDNYRVIVSNAGPKIVVPCDANTKDIYLDFSPEKTTEKIELDASGFSTGKNRIVFHHPDFFQNLIVDRTGYYQIIEDKDSTITIEVDVKFDDKNFMKGTFVATRCF